MCQTLLPTVNGKGRAMIMEILIPNAAVRNLIREDKIHQVYSAMQSGQDKFGMQTFRPGIGHSLFPEASLVGDLPRALQQSGRTAGNDQSWRQFVEPGNFAGLADGKRSSFQGLERLNEERL